MPHEYLRRYLNNSSCFKRDVISLYSVTAEVVYDAAESGIPANCNRHVRNWLRESHLGETSSTYIVVKNQRFSLKLLKEL